MVKRRKQEEIAGILEFEGRTAEDASFKDWMADHKARNGGKLRISKGGTGVRVMFSKEADMEFWQERDALDRRTRKAGAA